MVVQTSLYKLGKDIVREQQIEEVGGREPQIRDRPRWEVNESIPGEKLRPGAFKMQLRPHEEAALPLVSVLCLMFTSKLVIELKLMPHYD